MYDIQRHLLFQTRPQFLVRVLVVDAQSFDVLLQKYLGQDSSPEDR